MFTDGSGHSPEWLKWLGWAGLAVGAALSNAAITILTAGVGTATLAGAIAVGAAKGALIGAAIGIGVGATVGAVGSAIAGYSITDAEFWINVGYSTMAGFGAGALIGAVAGGIHGGMAYMRSTVIIDGQRVAVYRGGESMNLKSGEYRLTNDGRIRGISTNSNSLDPNVIKNGGAYRISNVPRGLQFNLTKGIHYELIPKYFMTAEKYQALLSKII